MIRRENLRPFSTEKLRERERERVRKKDKTEAEIEREREGSERSKKT